MEYDDAEWDAKMDIVDDVLAEIDERAVKKYGKPVPQARTAREMSEDATKSTLARSGYRVELVSEIKRAFNRKVRYIYFVYAEEVNRVKIGIANNAEQRLKDLRVGSPCELELLATFKDDQPNNLLENYLHGKFKKYRLHGEWFEYSDEIKNFIWDLPDSGYLVMAEMWNKLYVPDYIKGLETKSYR